MRRWRTPCLLLITDRHRLRGRPLEEVVSQAVDGGVNVVQLREKDLPTRELYECAITLHAVLRGRALLLVNDRADLALAAGADGVHLPERSLPVRSVRQLAGASCIIGKSVHSVDAALQAAAEGADYLEIGTVYETASKADAEPGGVELVRSVCESVSLPVVAVGGITSTNAAEIVRAGAEGVAVIGAIMDPADPSGAAAALRRALDDAYLA